MSIPIEVQVANQKTITIYDYAAIRDIVIQSVGAPSAQGPAMSHLFEGLPYPHDPDYVYRLRILLDVVPVPEEWVSTIKITKGDFVTLVTAVDGSALTEAHLDELAEQWGVTLSDEERAVAVGRYSLSLPKGSCG